MRRLSILGSTGSIGKQTLEVVRKAPGDFTVESLTCGSDIDTIFDQIKEFRPKVCSVVNESKALELASRLKSEGIEIEVDTIESERRKHLATVACSALILRCLDEGLYPSWDAQNMGSVHLSEKLGYEFDHEYVAYEVSSNMRTH